ncbi:MAG TPA: phenylalanine--tRNA ligase subunit beta, partial [Candidatus Dormibacteraeota bacterium]|nr:phenylalanine--tRNA ligase subunit beta [Candidatus Dormibacteraeota bacterium]
HGERQIVCGAHNFKAGDKVPLILPGKTLPTKPGEQPLTIKIGKIRGVESQGMMCSPQELGLPDQVDGLLLLREDAKVGQPFAEYLGRSAGDVVYDLEITPNRPDLNSVIGIAREIAAVTGNALKLPKVQDASPSESVTAESLVSVKLEDSEVCPRYVARVIRGVKVGPSPDWLRNTLEKVGIRSISNVVDVTNYVMLECGQPLHAFDYSLLAKKAGASAPSIVVRHAGEGEKFVTLDGQERTLTSQMLLIADETKPLALAGVMGGQNSEINPDTQDVLLESAYFKPQNIRATSKKLDLRTESSYRFERGGDIGVCDFASRRAAQLILETAGGELAAGAVDAYPNPFEPKQVALRHSQAGALLGVNLPPETQSALLRRLGLEVTPESSAGSQTTVFRVPSFRVDIKREIDLIEEIARLYGVEKIPSTPPRGALGSNPYDALHDVLAEARRLLVSMGLSEAQGQTLISDSAAKLVVPEAVVPLANPLSSDMNVLRPSLLPGLLDALRHNVSRRNYDLALFEVGRVFSTRPANPNDGSGGLRPGTNEQRRLAIALTGHRFASFWAGEQREARFDLHDLKGMLEEFFEHFGDRAIGWTRRPESTPLFLESATVQLGKFPIGQLGQLLPSLARQYDLRDPVLLAELDLDLLMARRNPAKSFKAIPALPSVRRDVAMVVPEPTTHDAVLQVVRQAKPAHLESVELFDVFRGKNVPEGQKSLAYAFTYRSAERSLTDAEVNAVHEKLLAQFTAALHAQVRDK